MAAQPQHRHAQQQGEGHGQHDAERQAGREGQLPLHHGDRHAVAAQAIEHRIAEGRVAGVPANDVPSLREHGQQQGVDAELHQYVRAVPGHAGQGGHRRQRQDRAPGFHAALPSRPLGRRNSTSTRMPKLATSANVGPTYSVVSDSMMPRNSPPTMTPSGLSSPPMMEMAKHFAVSVAPM
ncbi:hypothetical protein D9M69_576450 [compost metagenome]